MPCMSIITNTVELKNVKNEDLLLKSLADLGGARVSAGHLRFYVNGVAVDLRDGQATSTLSRDKLGAVLDLVKQSYSREAVKFAAKRFGWVIEKGTDINNYYLRKG